MIKKYKKGFTLIEMIISISIISVIMATVLFNYTSFSDKLALSSAAQEIAVSIRQAQTFGLSVRGSTAVPGQFTSGYGIFFDMNSNTSKYYLFIDRIDSPFGNGTVANKKYDVVNGCGSSSTECIEKGEIRNNVVISNLCDSTTCPPVANVKQMHVTFLRPNPDAIIYFTDVSGNILSGPSNTGKVTLISPKGNTINVIIEKTGQVLVQ